MVAGVAGIVGGGIGSVSGIGREETS
jgi:hypothetical protein